VLSWQVQSRVQKYFLKLQRAGLPVPGKLAKGKHRLTSKAATSDWPRTSTFFPGAPVKMMEDAEEDEVLRERDQHVFGNSSSAGIPNDQFRRPILNDRYYLEPEDVSDEEGVDEELRSTPDYRKLIWLKRIRREQELESQRTGGPHVHRGFRCDGCGIDPIVGGRFQCSECIGGVDTVDFCCECAPKGLTLNSVSHLADHTLKPVRLKLTHSTLDAEYSVAGRSGYLDPNFVN